MEPVTQLTQFGLTRQEAALYLILLSNGELTGYEAAKLSGISRSNTYGALAGLCDKGAAYVIESSPTHYTPVNPAEFCENVVARMKRTEELLLQSLPEPKPEAEEYITIKGERHILDKMRTMLRSASERVYISVAGSALAAVLPDLEDVLKRGLKLVVLTKPPFHLEGAIFYPSDKGAGQIGLIADSSSVLTGDIAGGEASTCLYSKKRNLVELFKDAMRNEIKLIELTEGTGSK